MGLANACRVHVTAEPSVLQGKRGLRVTISEETLRRIERTQQHAQGLVWIEDLDFSNGVIEAEIAGALAAERSTRLSSPRFPTPSLPREEPVHRAPNQHGGEQRCDGHQQPRTSQLLEL
jgi:hypothetical protein